MAQKLDRAWTDFSAGLNTVKAAHLLEPNELRIANWTDITEEGAITKAQGLTNLVTASLGTGGIQGLFSLVKKDATEVILAVWNQRLYKQNGDAWTQIPVRLYACRDLTATEQAAGTVGANILASTEYRYQVVAVKGAGKVPSAEVVITTDGTPNPIDVSARGSYGADTYEIYRKTGAGGTWGLMVSGLTHADVDMGSGRLETRVTWTDDGSIAPDTALQPPGSNDTELFIPSGVKVDFEQDKVNLDYAYFSGGDGLLFTDGTTASVVTPDDYDATYGANSLHQFGEPIHKCKVLTSHSDYNFAMDNSDEPSKVYYSRLGRWDYWPGLGALNSDTGGQVGNAVRLYNVLGVSTTRGVSSLHGKTFTPDSVNFDGYWSTISVVGISSGRSFARVAARGRDILVGAGKDKNIYGIYAETAVESFMNARPLADHIKPTLASLTDWDNATAVYHKGRYIISFPADSQVWVGYPDRRVDGQFAWFGPRDGVAVSCWAVRKDGTLLAGDASNGLVYVWESGYAYADGTAYKMWAKTKDFEQVLRMKKLRKAYVKGKQETSTTTCTVRVNADYETVETTGISFNVSGVIGEMTIGEDYIGYLEAPLELTGLRAKGRSLSYEVENEVAGEPLTVYGFYELYSLKKPR